MAICSRDIILSTVCVAVFASRAWSDTASAATANEAASASFAARYDASRGGLTRLIPDGSDLDFLAPDRTLGDIELRVRSSGQPWRIERTAASRDIAVADNRPDTRTCTLRYEGRARATDGLRDLAVVERFAERGPRLEWTIELRNTAPRALEIGDLAVPLPIGVARYPDKKTSCTRSFYRHQFISGDGSFLFWQPVAGQGACLVMQPLPETKLEFFTDTVADYALGGRQFRAFVHSASTGPALRGTWRQPHTSRTLAPGQMVRYGFVLQAAPDLAGVRNVLYANGGFDVAIAPGMVLPRGIDALVALRTRNRIARIEPEFPAESSIEPAAARTPDSRLFRVRLSKLGENRLTVRYNAGQTMFLEFFVTEPLETLVKKRAAFISAHQQHRDPSRWYDGLFSLWDVRLPAGKNLLGPDNCGGQHPYAVSGSDDPSNGKSLYLAEKNAAYPNATEIAAIEYYLQHFVWGKLQRTDAETPLPYGIYGSDSWRQNRFASRDPLAKAVSRPGGPSACRMWRTFDYTTSFALYYDMYRIARQNPDMVKYLDARGYLERAFGTAKAFFEVPAAIHMEGGWAFTGWVDWQFALGNFHEKYLLAIIDALRREGQADKAAWLHSQWEKKVKYFIYDDPYPWGSEMPFDSTAFESTYAIARYALTNSLTPDERLWQDKNSGRWYSHPRIDAAAHRDFLRRQLAANLACRGTIEPAYYTLGSDFRGCGESFYMLSYMSQLGGWSLVDQAWRLERRPHELLRLGTAAMLSSWALVNAGPPEDNFGYWWPGPRHDGAVGWGFTVQKAADEWNPAVRAHPRGPWPVDGEIDHGLTAGVEGACTVATEDPLFGWIALPGNLTRQADGSLHIVPGDAARQRFVFLHKDRRVLVALDRDGFAAGRPLVFDASCRRVELAVEGRSPAAHRAVLMLAGLPPGQYTVHCNNRESVLTIATDPLTLTVDVPAAGHEPALVRLTR
jgi:hypothetical protein